MKLLHYCSFKMAECVDLLKESSQFNLKVLDLSYGINNVLRTVGKETKDAITGEFSGDFGIEELEKTREVVLLCK